VCSLYELEEETASLLADGLSPSQFLTVLMENNKYPEAAHFIAFALPKREAAWLACLTARNALGDKPTEKELKAIEKAEKWVYKSTEENRQSAMSAAEDAGYNTPAGLAAAAVAWSGGSLAPSGAPAVPPPEDLTAKAVWAAMTLAAFMPDPDKAKDKYRTFISQAIDIANGGSGKAA
jgi:hypothetical protein